MREPNFLNLNKNGFDKIMALSMKFKSNLTSFVYRFPQMLDISISSNHSKHRIIFSYFAL